MASDEAPRLRRPEFLTLQDALVELPCLFASVSSVKTNPRPASATEIIRACGFPQFLVSAYDIAHTYGRARTEFYGSIAAARSNGQRVLLDSGNYESFWLRDGSRWNRKRFHEILRRCPCDLALSFDKPVRENRHMEPEYIIANCRQDQRVASVPVIPIVHVPEGATDIADRVVKVAYSLRPIAVAVAERELGSGVFARAVTVAAIREGLSAAGMSTPLHILGTGNPLTLLVLAAAGADSFDGLEWCQTVVDFDSALLYHMQQYDMFRHQSAFGEAGMPFVAAAMAHNLLFYRGWMERIRNLIAAQRSAGHGLRSTISLEGFPPEISTPLIRLAHEWFVSHASPTSSIA